MTGAPQVGDRLTFGRDPMVWVVTKIEIDADGFPAYSIVPAKLFGCGHCDTTTLRCVNCPRSKR